MDTMGGMGGGASAGAMRQFTDQARFICYHIDNLISVKEAFEAMPLYEYYCTDCRGKFEVLTSYEASRADMVCATCHGGNVRKLLSVFARPSRGSGDGDFGEFSDGGEDFGGGGGCACGGGSCGCHN